MSLTQEQLEHFKQKLLAEKSRLEDELSRFARKDESGDYHTEFPEDIGSRNDENASEVEEYADNLALEQSLEGQLREVNDALARIEKGTYGVCEKTGREIPLERLEAYPAARTVVDA
ncbi:MAG TPA: hypothetical protein ENJ77_00485 [Candidatus Moranbacteria bacterium]|nr:hypothetical protein [Candidatus Moranbacteria bacterium]